MTKRFICGIILNTISKDNSSCIVILFCHTDIEEKIMCKFIGVEILAANALIEALENEISALQAELAVGQEVVHLFQWKCHFFKRSSRKYD